MNFSDPFIWMCGGLFVVCLVVAIWVIGRLRTPKLTAEDELFTPPPEETTTTLDIPSPFAERPKAEPMHDTPPPSSSMPPSIPSSVLTPAFSKEISDRLEAMTQRLGDMQSVLAKQPPIVAAPGTPGVIGQGLSPETIDKLLKIIGNVVTQVDVLQKNLNLSKEAAGKTVSAAPGAPVAGSPAGAPPRVDPLPKA